MGGWPKANFFQEKRTMKTFFVLGQICFLVLGGLPNGEKGVLLVGLKKTTFSQIVLTTPFNERIILTLLRFEIVA